MSALPVLVLGSSGQVGSALVAQLEGRAWPLSHAQLDLASDDVEGQLDAIVGELPVAALINAAGYTQVDRMESEPEASGWAVNAHAPAALARWCKRQGVPFVHYSTDYVFDGKSTTPYKELDATVPLNAYGKSKLAGEEAVLAEGGKSLILRSSWIYNAHGRNFFNTMLRLFAQREEIEVVSDQLGAPTYAPHLAQATLATLEKTAQGAPYGLYHLCSGGQTSWHGFAEAILSLARAHDSGVRCRQIRPISSLAYSSPVVRPSYSCLNCDKAATQLGVAIPHWEEGLKECIKEYYANNRLSHSRPETDPT